MAYLAWAIVSLAVMAFSAYGTFVLGNNWFLLLLLLVPTISKKETTNKNDF